MKKILVIISILFLCGCGCSTIMNTPTKKVEEFFGKYQTVDSEVMKQLDGVVFIDETLDENQKVEYKKIMKRQYQNMMYKIKDETVNGETAVVEVEIEVYDYKNAMKVADNYIENNKKDFMDKEGNTLHSKILDYKIEAMSNTKEKVKYTLSLTTTKKDGKWFLDEVSDSVIKKIHGVY